MELYIWSKLEKDHQDTCKYKNCQKRRKTGDITNSEQIFSEREVINTKAIHGRNCYIIASQQLILRKFQNAVGNFIFSSLF